MKTTDMKSFKEIVHKTILKEFTVDKNGKPIMDPGNSNADVLKKHGYTAVGKAGQYDKPHTDPDKVYTVNDHGRNGWRARIYDSKKGWSAPHGMSGKIGITPEELDKHLTDLHKL